MIQPGRNRWNAAIFAGSAAMFRRKALEEIGGFAIETITEDLHTGLRLHARGWKSLAVTERLIAGQAAPDVTTFHSQRLRWGEGNLSIFAYDNPLSMRGLTLAQRLCYLGSMIHWAGGPFLLLIYLTPLLMLFSGVPPVNAFRWDFAGPDRRLHDAQLRLVHGVSSGRLGSFWNSQLFSHDERLDLDAQRLPCRVPATLPEVHRHQQARPAEQERAAVHLAAGDAVPRQCDGLVLGLVSAAVGHLGRLLQADHRLAVDRLPHDGGRRSHLPFALAGVAALRLSPRRQPAGVLREGRQRRRTA